MKFRKKVAIGLGLGGALMLAAAAPAPAQETVINLGPGETANVSVTVTNTAAPPDSTFRCPEDWLCAPNDSLPPPPAPDTVEVCPEGWQCSPPDSTLLPILRLANITAPATQPGSQLPELVSGSICAEYNANEGGIFSRDHNGFGSGGHLDFELRSTGELRVRSQTMTSSFVMSAGQLRGLHRFCYLFGPDDSALYADGRLVASSPHDGSMAGNDNAMVFGGRCVTCSPGTTDRITQPIQGQIIEIEIFGKRMSEDEAQNWSFMEQAEIPPPPPPADGSMALARIDTLTDVFGNLVLMVYALPDIRAQQVVTYVDGVETGRIEAKVSPCYPGTSSSFRYAAGNGGTLDPFNAGPGEWGCHMGNNVMCSMISPDDWHAVTPCAGRTVRMTPRTRACSDPYTNQDHTVQCWVAVKNPMLVRSPRLPKDGQPHTVRIDLLDSGGEAFATYEAIWQT